MKKFIIPALAFAGAFLLFRKSAAAGLNPNVPTASAQGIRPELGKILAMRPKAAPIFEAFFRTIEKELGAKVIVTNTVRTYEDSLRIWQDWEAKRLAGQISYNPAAKPNKDRPNSHERGIAVDINVVLPSGKQLKLASSDADWKPVYDIARRFGMTVGGEDFSGNHDPIHYDLRKLEAEGKV